MVASPRLTRTPAELVGTCVTIVPAPLLVEGLEAVHLVLIVQSNALNEAAALALLQRWVV